MHFKYKGDQLKHKMMCLIIVIAISGCSNQKHTPYVESQSFGIVVSETKYATEVGKKILEDGGNAIDASVGVGFALAVTYPEAGNLGGGGFMVLRLKDGSRTSIDYREKAPQKASRDMYLDSDGNHLTQLSQEGYLSVGVPGSVAGMLFALEKYGTMSIEQVLMPSYKLAKEGFRVGAKFAFVLDVFKDKLSKYPSTADIFLKDSLTAYEEGDIFKQPDLAATIDRIIKQGNAGFYSGRTAELFVSTMNKYGGLITKEDLKSYKPVEREPIIGNYRGYDIISMPPSSSGGTLLIELLNILEEFDLSSTEPLSSAYLKLYIEASKFAFADRAEHLGDMDFYPVPINKLISKEYARTIVNKIKINGITPSDEILYQNEAWLDSVESDILNESSETTHYSVIDQWGNAAAVTTTINSLYGSKVIVEGAGFFLNNEMDDFAAKPGSPNIYGLVHGQANSIEPNKRMLSSLSPTIVVKDGETVLVLGARGGSGIISAVAQNIIYYIDFGMEPDMAVEQPRVHHQWLPDILFYEPDALDSLVISDLEKLGYDLRIRTKVGNIQLIGKSRSSNLLTPAPDKRGGGYGVVIRN